MENPHRDLVHAQLAAIGQALASPRRVRLLSLLAQGEKAVDRLAHATGQSMASTSAHLQVLRRARLVSTRREGRHVLYRLASDQVSHLLLDLLALGRELVPDVREVVREVTSAPDVVELGVEELVDRARSGEIVIVDLRPSDEYAARHLPGARSIPFAELEARLGELPRDRPVVAYCRGPFCVMAREGVRRMSECGVDARRLVESVPHWAARDLPLEETS